MSITVNANIAGANVTSPMGFREADDPTGLADTGQIYTNDVAGRTELMYKDDTGAEIQITSAGALNVTTGTFFTQNGNAFGTTARIGTNDAFGLELETNNIARVSVNSDGEVGIGVAASTGTQVYILSTNTVINIQRNVPATTGTIGVMVVQAKSTTGEPGTTFQYFWSFQAKNNVDAERNHGDIGAAPDSAGASTGRLFFRTFLAGSPTEQMRISSDNSININGSFSIGNGMGYVPTAGVDVLSTLLPAGRFLRRDSSTTTALEVMRIERHTTGTSAAGLGLTQGFYLEDNAGTDVEAARIQVDAEDAVAGTFSARIRYFSRINGTTAERYFLRETTFSGGTGVFDVIPTTNLTGHLGVISNRWVEGVFGSISGNVRAVVGAATPTLDVTDMNVTCDATGGNITINLPAASTTTGRIYNIKRIDGSANTVTIDGSGAETIDDAATRSLVAQYSSISIFSDGTEWWII